jgi:hypothetical protein
MRHVGIASSFELTLLGGLRTYKFLWDSIKPCATLTGDMIYSSEVITPHCHFHLTGDPSIDSVDPFYLEDGALYEITIDDLLKDPKRIYKAKKGDIWSDREADNEKI